MFRRVPQDLSLTPLKVEGGLGRAISMRSATFFTVDQMQRL